MRRLCALLGMPQNRFASVHVVGTNGKTSVARMTAALLERHGVRTGAYLSPHIHSWTERVELRGEPISEGALVDALERAEQAAEVADRSAPEDEGPVTQYELLTAAAFVALAAARVQLGVIEAGLGGRLDATNVIPSRLTVLTSVGLDHTEWLGDTIEQIAAEKLAVLRDHTALLHGPLPPEAEALAREAAGRHHASLLEVEAPPAAGAGTGGPGGERRGYQAANLALAVAAAEQVLGREPDPEAVSGVWAELSTPGRAELVAGDPPVILDAAHNPEGARALAQSLSALAAGADVVCCLAVLGDKDASGIVAALAPVCRAFVCTEVAAAELEGVGRPGAHSREAEELARLVREAGAEAEAITDPGAAWARARELARERGAVALAAGSHYLLGTL